MKKKFCNILFMTSEMRWRSYLGIIMGNPDIFQKDIRSADFIKLAES